MPYNKSFIDQASPVDLVSVHKNEKRELGQYPAILTSRLVNNIYVQYLTLLYGKASLRQIPVL